MLVSIFNAQHKLKRSEPEVDLEENTFDSKLQN